jgi:predicted nucleotidyltransferase
MLDKAKARQVAAQFTQEVKKVLHPTKIVIFGSYVNGSPHEYSDIDIAVVVNNFRGNWLETSSLLFNLAWDINVDIEPHIMDETHDSSGFLEHILKTGEIIYEA